MGGERRATNESDHEKLVQALNMIIGVAMGERLDSMRHTAKELDSRLSTLIGSAKKETTGAIDSVRSAAKELDSKLSARVDSVKRETTESIGSLRDAIKEMESKTADSVATATKQVAESMDSTRQEIGTKMVDSIAVAKKETTESMDKLQHSVLTRTAEMIGRLSSVEENQQRILDDLGGQTPNELEKQMQVRVLAVKNELDSDVSGLRRELANLRDELKQQMQATERVSAFLNSMASVFSVSPPRPQVEQGIPPGPDPVPFVAAPQLTREEVDTAVERALGEEWTAGKTVEMLNPLFREKKK